MANDREIEVKLQVGEIEKLLAWLKKNAVLEKEVTQTDFYFDPPDRSFIFTDPEGYQDAAEWFRVRLEGDRAEVCYKHWHREETTNKSTYADEIEIPIADGERFLLVLGLLGFKKTSKIEKQRSVWHYREFEFAIDRVKGLGDFVEIEYQGKVTDPFKAKQKIFKMLAKVGTGEWRKSKRGYCFMQWNPGKDHFE